MAQQILKSAPVAELYERQQDSLNVKIVLLLEGVLIAFFPFLLPLLPMTFYIWHIDRADLSGDYVRKVDKRRLWVLPILIPSFFFFVLFVFKYIPKNDFPVWGLYPELASPLPLWENMVIFIVILIATAYLTKKFRDFCKRWDPLVRWVDEEHLIVPTQTHGPVFMDSINTGIMVAGSPGGGKTELIKQFMAQLPSGKDDAWIVFDPKGDYIKEFAKEGDIILKVDGGSHAWNVFWELEIDPESDEVMQRIDPDIAELAAGILSDEDSFKDKFWIQSARQVLYAIIYMKVKKAIEMYWMAMEGYEKEKKKAEEEGKEPPPKPDIDIKDFLPTNYDLADYVRSTPQKQMYEDLKAIPKLRSIAEFTNPKGEKMTMSIKATLTATVEKVFIGSFGSPNSAELPQMSIREYMHNPNGRKLFVYYDITRGKVLGSIYKVLIERAIKFALSNECQFNEKGELRKKMFVIDEFQNIPPIDNYQQLVNYGRTMGCISIIGIQTLAQVDEKYKQEGTNSIVAGHGYVISFRTWDPRTSEFLSNRIGKKKFWIERPVQVSGERGGSTTIGREPQLIEYSPVEEQDVRKMKPGEAWFVTPYGFKKIRIYPYEQGVKIIRQIEREITRLRLKRKYGKMIKQKKKEMAQELAKKKKEMALALAKERERHQKELRELKKKQKNPLKPPKKRKHTRGNAPAKKS